MSDRTQKFMNFQYPVESKVLVAVDCIIFGFDENEEILKVLLIKRDLTPHKGEWSLMGGFLEDEETVDDAATRVLHTLTGLDNIYMEQLHVFSETSRDPVERTISVAYIALININDHDEKLIQQYSARWFALDEKPSLIFDHDGMFNLALERLRRRVSTQPIGFELLPEKFTMRQLQKLYEEILATDLDKRNFSKKINSLEILKKLNEKDKRSSRKGSYLFKFDQEKYDEKSRQGFHFKI